MKAKTFTLRTNLLGKLLLSLALLIGSVNAWADTTIVDGNVISAGWNNGGASGKSCSQTSSAGVAFYTTTEGQLTAQGNYSWHSLHSSNSISITTGQTVVLRLKGRTTSAKYEFSYSTNNSTFSNVKNTIGSTSGEFVEYKIENVVGDFYLYLWTYAIDIQSIIIKDADTPVMSVSPTTGAEFGSLAETDAKTYTVSNIGAGSLNVTVSNDNTKDFTISQTSISGISGGESETFTITFNYNNEDLGEKTATITITPNAGDAVVITATATAISDNDPLLSVSPDNDTDLGSVYSGEVVYTVTNTGTGLMTVNISSDNSDFVVSPATITNLARNASETFTVTYTFEPTVEKLGLNSANITVTPTYVGGVAKTYEVSATSNASMTLDEDNPTTVNYGEKAYLHVKYKPSSGWNTICMPFVLRNTTMNNMDIIFGENWKAYTLSSYNDGTISFNKVSSYTVFNSGAPYLVYVESAPSHPNGVLLSNIYTNGNTPGNSIKGGATFQGTYVRKDYVDDDNWYGVTSAGKIMKAISGAFVRGYRAYFTGISAPTPGAEVKMIVLDDEGGTTDLGFVKMVDENAKEVYNLAGQKVQKGRKGIYIVNGKKVVIK